MPRAAKPWFNKHTNWWCTDIAGKRVKLLKGIPADARRRTPPAPVLALFHRLMAECAVNSPADSGPAVVTVPSIVDEYLEIGCVAQMSLGHSRRRKPYSRGSRTTIVIGSPRT